MTTREIQSRLNALKKELDFFEHKAKFAKSPMECFFGFGLFLCDSEKKMQSVCERIVPLMKETFPMEWQEFVRIFNKLVEEVVDYQKNYAKRAEIQKTAISIMKEMKGATVEERLNALPAGVWIDAYIGNDFEPLRKIDTEDKKCWQYPYEYKLFCETSEIKAFSIAPAYNKYISECEQTPRKQAIRYMRAENESYNFGYYYGRYGSLVFNEKCEWIIKNRWNLHENY